MLAETIVGCPGCGRHVSIPHAGTFACTACGASFLVPASPAATVDPPACDPPQFDAGFTPGVSYLCPACAAEQTAPFEWSGKQVACRQCGAHTVVPGGPSRAPAKRPAVNLPPWPWLVIGGGGVALLLYLMAAFLGGSTLSARLAGGPDYQGDLLAVEAELRNSSPSPPTIVEMSARLREGDSPARPGYGWTEDDGRFWYGRMVKARGSVFGQQVYHYYEARWCNGKMQSLTAYLTESQARRILDGGERFHNRAYDAFVYANPHR